MNKPALIKIFSKIILPFRTYSFEHNKQQVWDKQAVEWTQAGDYSELPEFEIIWRDIQSYVLPIVSENNIHEAIDIGCGRGWLVRRLARVMDHVYGYDISPALIEHLKKDNFERQNVSLDCADLSISHPPLKKSRYLVTTMYVLSHNSVNSVKSILKWVDSICEPGSVCLFSEAWKIKKTAQLSPSDYIHGIDNVWGRFLSKWDLSFFGDTTSPFEADRVYFRKHPRENLNDRVGKGILGIRMR